MTIIEDQIQSLLAQIKRNSIEHIELTIKAIEEVETLVVENGLTLHDLNINPEELLAYKKQYVKHIIDHLNLNKGSTQNYDYALKLEPYFKQKIISETEYVKITETAKATDLIMEYKKNYSGQGYSSSADTILHEYKILGQALLIIKKHNLSFSDIGTDMFKINFYNENKII